MGLSKSTVTILYWLKQNNLLKSNDSVMELGSQQINNDITEDISTIDYLAELFNVAPFSKTFSWQIKEKKVLAGGMQHLPEDAPYAKELYEHLGLNYQCVDIDENHQSIQMDLNFDSVPKKHLGKYQLVTNFGTTEHAVNQLNAFKIIHDFTAPNGIMMHTLPFQGFSAHGFFSYTMQFFWMLCRSNLYKVIDVNISAWEPSPLSKNIVDFAKENSQIFQNKSHIEKLELRDTGIEIVLQKCHNIDFIPPIDVPNETRTDDPVMKKRYWTVFDPNSLNMYLLRGKSFLNKFFHN